MANKFENSVCEKKPWVLKYKRNKQNHAVVSVSCEKQSNSHSMRELMIMWKGWHWVSLFSGDPFYHSKTNEQCGHHDKAEMLNGLAAWTSKAVRQLSVKSANKSPKLNPQLTLEMIWQISDDFLYYNAFMFKGTVLFFLLEETFGWLWTCLHCSKYHSEIYCPEIQNSYLLLW